MKTGQVLNTQSASEALYEEVRAYSKKSLFYFAATVMGFKDMTPNLHLPFCNYMQMLPWFGGPQNSRRKLGIMPREHFKSSVVSCALPLWLLIHDPNTTIALISAKDDNTKKWLRFIKSTITNNQMFRWAFPEIRPFVF